MYKLLTSLLVVTGHVKELFSSDALVWGPGLSPVEIIMPARYIFIKIPNDDSRGNSGDFEKRLQVEITGQTKARACRVWVNKLDRKDGSFIVRYKVYEPCRNFKIQILFDSKHVSRSPYLYTDEIQPDLCYCPKKNYTQWMERYGCTKKHQQIEDDLKPFNRLQMSVVSKKIVKKFNQPSSVSICHYAIKDNKLYRKCYGQHVGFKMFSDAILLSLMRKVYLPDTQFFVNLGDWPLAKTTQEPLPIFSWCKSAHTYDIVLPTYDITEATLENMGRIMLDMLSVQGNIDKSWDEKIESAFWRGRDSREERLKLIDISRQHPELFNASLTNFFFFRDKEEVYGKMPHISFFKFFDYKYQLNIDGTVAAYRFPYLLAGDSLVFKQESPYYEHFYSELIPGVHYVSFKRDLSDLVEKIKWARINDQAAKEISQNGQEYARNNLLPQDIFCYHAEALLEWTKRIEDEVIIADDMEYVPQSEEAMQCKCNESHNEPDRDEL